MRETTESLGGVERRVYRGGDGPALLFLHGLDGGGRAWPVLDRLAERFTVIAPDHPGFGGTDLPDWLEGIGDLALHYLDVLDQMDREPMHLVGVSLGGWLAAEMAIRNTGRIDRLVLAGAPGLKVPGAERADVFLMSREARWRCLVADAGKADGLVALTAADEADDTEPRLRLAAARLAWQPRWHDPHLAKWLHRIDRPTLLLWGEKDRLTPPAHAEAYAAGIPEATVQRLAGAGHLCHLEQPEAFAAGVTAFLTEGAR